MKAFILTWNTKNQEHHRIFPSQNGQQALQIFCNIIQISAVLSASLYEAEEFLNYSAKNTSFTKEPNLIPPEEEAPFFAPGEISRSPA